MHSPPTPKMNLLYFFVDDLRPELQPWVLATEHRFEHFNNNKIFIIKIVKKLVK